MAGCDKGPQCFSGRDTIYNGSGNSYTVKTLNIKDSVLGTLGIVYWEY